jgi:hypothetical protein
MKQLIVGKGTMKYIKEKVNLGSFTGFLLYFCLFRNSSNAMKNDRFFLCLLSLIALGLGTFSEAKAAISNRVNEASRSALLRANRPFLMLSTEDSLSLRADQILQKAYLVDDYIRLVKHRTIGPIRWLTENPGPAISGQEAFFMKATWLYGL